MGKYFGTDGFRGEVNLNLTAEHAFKIGRFLGWYYREKCEFEVEGMRVPAPIVIGMDTRRSGEMLESALVAGLTASGADAYLLGVVPTPAVAFITRAHTFACGIMISASHNPYFDNGIKLFNGEGEKMDESVIALVEEYLDGKGAELPYATRAHVGRVYTDGESGLNYINYLLQNGSLMTGKKVGLDCANGSAYTMAKTIFEGLGATVEIINDTPDGVNINENAGSTHIENLQKLVKEKGLDVGFAFDGDADRCLCVDEKGNVVTGDHILYVYGKYLKARGKLKGNTVVTTVMSNFGLYQAFDELGIEYAKTAVGDKYVYEHMQKQGNVIGGEQSGHIIFSDLATTGDGILTALKMMEVLCKEGKSMSELCEGFTVFPQVLKNVRVHSKEQAMKDEAVLQAVKAVEEKLGKSGRILYRASGTEPLVRVMVEAESEKTCSECVEQVIDVLRECGHLA